MSIIIALISFKKKFNMKRTFLLLITILSVIDNYGQTTTDSIPMPDSIAVIVKKYVEAPSRKTSEEIFDSATKITIRKDSMGYFQGKDRIPLVFITDLCNDVANPIALTDAIKKSGINMESVQSDPQSLVKLYRKSNFDWNKEQVEFMSKQFRNIENFRIQYADYLAFGAFASTSTPTPRIEFVLRFYKGGKMTEELTSRRSVQPFKMPWKSTTTKRNYYNFGIEKVLYALSRTKPVDPPLTDKKLLETLVNKIVDAYEKELYVLAAESFKSEINELGSEFEILSKGEEWVRGKYIGMGSPRTFRIGLKNSYMMPNVSIQFMASKTGNTIYSRQSIKTNYKALVDTIQSIAFVSDYLKQDPRRKLDVYYFDNISISDFLVDAINKSPEKWKVHDEYVKAQRILSRKSKSPKPLNWDAIIASERVNCGCDLRYDGRELLKNAYFFEITNENRESSLWAKLPDGTVLLYAMRGEFVINHKYSEFGRSKGLQFPCRQFFKSGKLIPLSDKLSKGDELKNEWLEILK